MCVKCFVFYFIAERRVRRNPLELMFLLLRFLSKNNAHQIKGLVLVNPATSYERSHWRVIGSLIANAPGLETFGMAATLALATTVPDTAMVGALRTAVVVGLVG